MKILKKSKTGNKKLILFFNGWSVNPDIFGHLKFAQDFDMWVCYDYRDLEFVEELSQFTEIHLIAWSLGVWVANKIFSETAQNFISTTAINGSFVPINNAFGIPESVFNGTVQNLNNQNFVKFNRRVCGTKEVLQNFNRFSLRNIEEIFDELINLFQKIKAAKVSAKNIWQKAIISENDAIFSAQNLQNFWLEKSEVKNIKGSHFPFFSWQTWGEIWM